MPGFLFNSPSSISNFRAFRRKTDFCVLLRTRYSYVLKRIYVRDLYKQFSKLHTSSSKYICITLTVFVHFLFKINVLSRVVSYHSSNTSRSIFLLS